MESDLREECCDSVSVTVEPASVGLLRHFGTGQQSTSAASSQLTGGTFLQYTTHDCADSSGTLTYYMQISVQCYVPNKVDGYVMRNGTIHSNHHSAD
jgi:hypothetical protein